MNIQDQRFFKGTSSCDGNFHKLDRDIVKISKHETKETSVSYLESNINCFEEKNSISGKSDEEFKFQSKIEFLKKNIEITRTEVCKTYVLLKPRNYDPKDSKCTKATNNDFKEFGILFSHKDNAGSPFFNFLKNNLVDKSINSYIYNYKVSSESTSRTLEYSNKKDVNINFEGDYFAKEEKHYIYEFNFEYIPQLLTILNMTDGKNNNLFLLRFNSQDTNDGDEGKEIPPLNKLLGDKAELSLKGIINSGAILTYKGGEFHTFFPVKREKLSYSSEVVFIVDRKLQIELNKFKSKDSQNCKIKGTIFKVIFSEDKDQDKDLQDSSNNSCSVIKEQIDSNSNGAQKAENIVSEVVNSYSVEDKKSSSTDAAKEKKRFEKFFPSKIDFAKPYDFYYLELRLFEKTFLLSDGFKMENIYLGGMEYLLDKCFTIYWPPFKPTYRDLEMNIIQPQPTFNFAIPFRYTDDWTMLARFWVKFNFHFETDFHDKKCKVEIEKDKNEKEFRLFKKSV